MMNRSNALGTADSLKAWTVIPLLLALRIVRIWNQTGQKHAGEADIARTVLPAHNILLWLFVLATYLNVIQRLARKAMPWASRQLSSAASLALGVAALGFKVAFTKADAPELLDGLGFLVLRPMEEASLVAQARAVFFSLAIMATMTTAPTIYQRFCQDIQTQGIGLVINRFIRQADNRFQDISQPLHDLFTLFLMTQSRATNIPLFLLFEGQFYSLRYLQLSGAELTLTSLLFQHASFFAFGGSNAISSIDLSNAYNGIGGYSVGAVGVLTFCGNWAGPLWWTSAIALLLSEYARRVRQQVWARHLSLLTTFASNDVLFVMLACTALRTHLFIWTVFSPKYLYSIAWSIGQHLCISIGYGSLLFWIGSW